MTAWAEAVLNKIRASSQPCACRIAPIYSRPLTVMCQILGEGRSHLHRRLMRVLVLVLSTGIFRRGARSWHIHGDAVGVRVGLCMRWNVHMCRRLALVSWGLQDGVNGLGLLLLREYI